MSHLTGRLSRKVQTKMIINRVSAPLALSSVIKYIISGVKHMFARPKEAATVIVLRRRSEQPVDGFELLMVLRSKESKFVPSSYVFPGGALDEEDCSPEMEALCRGVEPSGAFAALKGIPTPAMALGTWVAGIRETFEEVGLLLAYQADRRLLSFDHVKATRYERYRSLLNQAKLTFGDMLQKEALTLATDRLHYFSHWITPWFLPIRYDVRFFVVEAPAGQEAHHDGVELTDHIWITPQEALRRYRGNRFEMVYPTLMTIQALLPYRTIDEVIHATAGKNIPAESG
jgi:8-oxo-dGTP pyrophosphatase MutT (NUDIX family)